MKMITRTITVHKYTFGHININDLTAHDTFTLTTAESLGQKKLAKFCREHGDCVMLRHDTEDVLYGLPVAEFMAAAEQYAAAHPDEPIEAEE